MISSELIAQVATMKNPTTEKVMLLGHALAHNELRPDDPECLYRGCFHRFSQHGRTWNEPNGGRKRCRCKYMMMMMTMMSSGGWGKGDDLMTVVTRWYLCKEHY